jgi:hypothetical protein
MTVVEQQQEKRLGGESPVTEKARIHAALEKFSGDRVQAAAELGISIQDLKNRIYDCPDLKLRWSVRVDCSNPPDDISVLSMEQPITTQQERLAKIVQLEDAKLRKGLDELPLTSRERDMAMALQQFHRDNFASQLGIVNAGVTMTILKLITHIESIEARITVVRNYLISLGTSVTDERSFFVEEESALAEQYTTAVDQLRKIQAASYEGAKILATIRHRLNGGQNRKIKPQFQEIGSSMEIQQ